MHKLILIWIGIVVAFGVIFGFAPDLEQYLSNVTERFPDWSTLFDDVTKSFNSVTAFNWSAIEVTDLPSFFNAFGNFFVGVGNFFVFLYQIVLGLPIKIVIFVIQTFIALFPIDNIVVLGGAE